MKTDSALTYIVNIRFPTERAHGAQIMQTCTAFAEAGTEVTLVVPRRINTCKKPPHEYYAVRPNAKFRIIKLPVLDLIPWGVPFAFIIETATFAIASAWYLWRSKPSILYTRGESVLFLSRIISKYTALFWETHIKPNHIARYQRVFSKITGLITVTKIYAEELATTFHVLSKKIVVAPDGIDASFFKIFSKEEARKELSLPEREKVIMYFGLLERWKGVSTLLEAANTLFPRGIRVAIAGGSEAEISKLKKEYPRVIFLGHTEYRRLPRLQVAADILVVPNSAKSSVSTRYTSPLKVFAHMASGVPLLASDLPSLREVLDEQNAYFFEPDNADSLSAKVGYILANTIEAQTKVSVAKTNVRRYLWSERARIIIDFIQQHPCYISRNQRPVKNPRIKA